MLHQAPLLASSSSSPLQPTSSAPLIPLEMGKAKKKAGDELEEGEEEAKKIVKEESGGGGAAAAPGGGGGDGPAEPPPARKRGRPRKVILAVVQEAHEAAMKVDDSFKEELLLKAGPESKSKKHVAESKNDLHNGPPLPVPPKTSTRREGSRRKSEPKRAAH